MEAVTSKDQKTTAASEKFTPELLLEQFQGDELEQVVMSAMRAEYSYRARDDLLDFTRFTIPDPNAPIDPRESKYSVQPHHRLLAQALHEVEQGKCLRLAVSMPPQTGKSEICSRRFPAWFSGRHPEKHLLFGAYNQDFANEFGDDVRSVMLQPEFGLVFPNHGLRQGSKAKDHMVTTSNGKLSFLGRGGSGTGRPADGAIIDDPIKNAVEAESMATRNEVWNWFVRVMNSRLHSLSWCIIIMTRWHEDDLIGRLTDPTNPFYDEKVAAQWTYLNIPAILDDSKLAAALGKNLGDPLWPERFPLSLLETARRLDPVAFSALHMGRPTPPEGAFFKQEQLRGYELEQLPKNLRYYMTGDLAVSPERTADKSCVGVWGVDERDRLFLLPDLYWERKSSDVSVKHIIDLMKVHPIFSAYFERGQLDRAIGPFLEKRMQEEHVYGVGLEKLPVSGSKGARCSSFRGRCAQGKVFFPTFAHWWPQAKDQMLKFTGSGNDREDDFCDMCGLIGQALGDQIIADSDEPPEPVVKVGTWAWIRYEHDQRKRRNKFDKIMSNY